MSDHRYAVRLQGPYSHSWLGYKNVDSRIGPVEDTLRCEWDSRQEAEEAADHAGLNGKYEIVKVSR